VRLASSWREEVSAVDAASRVGQIPPGGLVLETGQRRQGTAAAGRVEVLRRTPTRMEIAVDAPEPTWLFVLRAYWDYRVVRVDGVEVETVPANLAFTAVPIPPGHHRVDWHEEVPGWTLSRFGPLLYAAVLLAFAVTRGTSAKK
jgi:hypothetical protein